MDDPPLRKYNYDVVDYYRLAISSNDPYIKFISFYHVIEYFYDEVFKSKLIEDLKEKLLIQHSHIKTITKYMTLHYLLNTD